MSAADPRRRELESLALEALEPDGVLDVFRQALVIQVAILEVSGEFAPLVPLLEALDKARKLADRLRKERAAGGRD